MIKNNGKDKRKNMYLYVYNNHFMYRRNEHSINSTSRSKFCKKLVAQEL